MIRVLVLALAAALLAACVNVVSTAPESDIAATAPVETGAVTFAFTPPHPAESVHLTGDFADWNATAIAMSDEDGDGTWTVTHTLMPGDYLYKFVVDGDEWLPDPENPEQADDGYDGFNSVLHVAGPPTP
jgi:1,4-alpha-glucan branching enzyme